MIIKPIEVSAFEITDLDSPMNPIRVTLYDAEPGKGRITIESNGKGWASYWGAMSGKTISEFFQSIDPDYAAEALTYGGKPTRVEYNRLIKIVQAVQLALHKISQSDASKA